MKHRFDTGRSKTDYIQQTFVIEINELTQITLEALSKYLISHVHLIFEKHQTIDEDVMWPVAIDINGQLTISEAQLWNLVCDCVPDAQNLVIEYIQKLCNLAKETEYGDLLYSDEYHFMGSFALIAFLDRYFEQSESRTMAALPIYQCFIQFIRHCDLESETFQDEYIEKVLMKLVFVDNDKSIELLCLRLCNGQLAHKEFRYLYHFLGYSTDAAGRLKSVIDRLSKNDSGIRNSRRNDGSIYLRLCAAIYGDNLEETEEVMDYVREKRGEEFEELQPFQLPEVQRIRSECEAFRVSQPQSDAFYNSSFHLYDLKNKKWLPLGADNPQQDHQ